MLSGFGVKLTRGEFCRSLDVALDFFANSNWAPPCFEDGLGALVNCPIAAAGLAPAVFGLLYDRSVVPEDVALCGRGLEARFPMSQVSC